MLTEACAHLFFIRYSNLCNENIVTWVYTCIYSILSGVVSQILCLHAFALLLTIIIAIYVPSPEMCSLSYIVITKCR